MNGLLRKLVTRRLRGIPAALCALAVAMQLMSPALHAGHELAAEHVVVAGVAAFQTSADQGTTQGRHDSTSCPQCRLVSQLRTLSPLSVVATLPAFRADWIADSTYAAVFSQAACDSASPRAPPFLA
jgi:hypothetical protein